VAQDYAKAREWYEKAAAKDEASALVNLGVLYDNGQGVAQDYAKAREWYEKAAAKDEASALVNLGLLYANGQGVAQDYAKAREWYEKAAAKDEASALVNLGLLYDNGQGVAQDYAKAREWYEKAAAKGDAEAKAQLEKLPISEAAGAGRYAEALQLQEALAAKAEAAETERETKPGRETAEALNGVAWYALFAREFTRALTAADRAHALLPDMITIETNRVHALMFLGRGEESKALYLAYKGKSVSEKDAKLWEHVIAEDFAELRKAGLTHPMMTDIEKELGVCIPKTLSELMT
jgi:TPR repeat protein